MLAPVERPRHYRHQATATANLPADSIEFLKRHRERFRRIVSTEHPGLIFGPALSRSERARVDLWRQKGLRSSDALRLVLSQRA